MATLSGRRETHVKLDDSTLEYALYEVLNTLSLHAGAVVEFDELRNGWRTTALRHSDLPAAIAMLVDSGSLTALRGREQTYWMLTAEGHARSAEIGDAASPTMADEVARSVLKTLRDRVAPGALAPRVGAVRRRSQAARDRARGKLQQRQG